MKLTTKLEKIGNRLTNQWLAVAVSFVLILPIAGILGMGNQPIMENREAEQERNAQIDIQKIADILETTKAVDLDGTEEKSTEEKAAEETDPLQSKYENLPEDQKQLLKDIYNFMESKDMPQAAKLLDKKQEVLTEMFYGTFEGQRFLYDGSSVSGEIDGTGLVFTMPEIIFYGSYQNGYPEGMCLALQFINVDSPRYNYSYGIWENGKMNGKGTTGYCYYENVPQGEYTWAVKTGEFADDQMEGMITYEVKGSDNTLSHWSLLISQGKIQLDDRWTHLEDMGEYQLMSSDSVSHAYVIADDQIDQLMWMNLLGWE